MERREGGDRAERARVERRGDRQQVVLVDPDIVVVRGLGAVLHPDLVADGHRRRVAGLDQVARGGGAVVGGFERGPLARFARPVVVGGADAEHIGLVGGRIELGLVGGAVPEVVVQALAQGYREQPAVADDARRRDHRHGGGRGARRGTVEDLRQQGWHRPAVAAGAPADGHLHRWHVIGCRRDVLRLEPGRRAGQVPVAGLHRAAGQRDPGGLVQADGVRALGNAGGPGGIGIGREQPGRPGQRGSIGGILQLVAHDGQMGDIHRQRAHRQHRDQHERHHDADGAALALPAGRSGAWRVLLRGFLAHGTPPVSGLGYSHSMVVSALIVSGPVKGRISGPSSRPLNVYDTCTVSAVPVDAHGETVSGKVQVAAAP
ncbi:hypothetical protein D3C81_1201840 [compost metagenome]